MKSRLIALLSMALCALVTSCYAPYPPMDDANTRPAPAPYQQRNDGPTAGDRAQQQLDAARERLKREEERAAREARDSVAGDETSPNVLTPPTPTTYRYATKVEGKEGFVHNPYTQNQVDVRGIPSGTLVRDPHDSNSAHKFRVP